MKLEYLEKNMKLKYFLMLMIIVCAGLLFAMYYSGRLEIAFRNSLSFEGWNQFVRSYDNRKKHPDCTGTVFVEINGLKINVQRNENTYVDFSYGVGRLKEYFLASRHLENYPLNRPNPDYSCNQEIINDVQELKIHKFSQTIPELSIFPPRLGQPNGDIQFLLSDERLNHLRGSKQINKDTGKVTEQKATFEKIDFPNNVIKLKRDYFGTLEETYILPSSELQVICTRSEICESFFWYEDGIFIRYIVKRSDKLEEKIPFIQKEIVDWLKKSIVSSEPKVHTQCFRMKIKPPECLKYTEEWRRNYISTQAEKGYR